MSTATSTTQRRGLFDRLLGRPARVESFIARRAPAPSEDGDSLQPEIGMEAPVDFRAPDETSTPPRHTWTSLIQRVREVTKATAVLAVDDQGLVVAATGDLASIEMENVAAHVALAFDLFERLAVLGKKTESICAQYVPDGTWLTAIRMRPPEGGRITIAIVGPYTLIREDRRKIRDAFARLFESSATEASVVESIASE